MVAWPPPWPWILCFTVILLVAIFSFIVILQTEGKRPPRSDKETLPSTDAAPDIEIFAQERKDRQAKGWDGVPVTLVFNQELWQACYGAIDPRWLLSYRTFFFLYFTGICIKDASQESWHTVFHFTQWNFWMLTAYFGVGAWFGFKACILESAAGVDPLQVEAANYGLPNGDEEQRLIIDGSIRTYLRKKNVEGEEAGALGYAMQAFYQIALPMALLVDAVLWGVLFPEAARDHHAASILNFVSYNQHGVNLLAGIGDFALNSMRYPWFRIAYVLLWGTVYTLFQWFLHEVLGYNWAYSFLQNDVPEAPLWYLGLLGFLLLCFWLWSGLHRVRLWLFPRSPEWLAYLQHKSDILYDLPANRIGHQL